MGCCAEQEFGVALAAACVYAWCQADAFARHGNQSVGRDAEAACVRCEIVVVYAVEFEEGDILAFALVVLSIECVESIGAGNLLWCQCSSIGKRTRAGC